MPSLVTKNQKSYESRITAILCGEGESNPSTRFTDKRPDLPLAGPSLLSAGAGLSRLSCTKKKNTMNKSAHHCVFCGGRGVEPLSAKYPYLAYLTTPRPLYNPPGAGLSRLSIDNYVWYMHKAHHCGFAVKKGLEPFTAHSIFGLPVQATPPVSLPFQAGLPSRACLSLCVFCVM